MPPRSKRAEPEDEENAGGRPFWSGTLTFGLVSVPVSLFPAARTVRTSLRMLGPDGQPLARKYYAEKTGKDLDADEVVRGYEITKEKFVIITDEELERLAPEKTRDIDLKQFVPAESIPPMDAVAAPTLSRGMMRTFSSATPVDCRLLIHASIALAWINAVINPSLSSSG